MRKNTRDKIGWAERFDELRRQYSFQTMPWAVEFISQTLADQKEETLKNVAMLRQWLNEKPTDRLVSNEDILHWLNLG